MKKVIGVTGGIATGKTTVSNIIRELGYLVIDSDKISHQILQDKRSKDGYKKIVSEFGTDILESDGSISRKKLGDKVFNDNVSRKKLEDILHPLIKKRIIELIDKSNDELIFVEVPLLFETDFYKLVDKTLLVYVDLDNQIWRLMKRNNIDFPTALKRIYMQMPIQEKLDLADYVIDNCHGEGDLKWQVTQLLNMIKGGK